MTQTIESLRCSMAANERWARLNADQRTAATAKARQKADERFAMLVDPEGTLSADERARQIKNARTAHFQRMALQSAKVRARGAVRGNV